MAHAMEHLNKATKGYGGITGITSYPATLLKFCLSAPKLGCIASEMEHLVCMSDHTPKEHHCLTKPKVM